MRILWGAIRRDLHLLLHLPGTLKGLVTGRSVHRACGENIGFRPKRIACTCGRVFYQE